MMAAAPERGHAGSLGPSREDWLERLGFGASLACLVHCLALPFLLAALPALSSALPISESFHVWILVLAVPASGGALIGGRVRHRSGWPLLLGGTGLLMLVVGALVLGGGTWETPTTIGGSLALGGAHVGNWRLRRRSHRCPAS